MKGENNIKRDKTGYRLRAQFHIFYDADHIPYFARARMWKYFLVVSLCNLWREQRLS